MEETANGLAPACSSVVMQLTGAIPWTVERSAAVKSYEPLVENSSNRHTISVLPSPAAHANGHNFDDDLIVDVALDDVVRVGW